MSICILIPGLPFKGRQHGAAAKGRFSNHASFEKRLSMLGLNEILNLAL